MTIQKISYGVENSSNTIVDESVAMTYQLSDIQLALAKLKPMETLGEVSQNSHPESRAPLIAQTEPENSS